MEITIIILAAINVALCAAIFFRKSNGGISHEEFESLRRSINETTQLSVKNLGELLLANQKNTDEMQMNKIGDMDKNITDKQEQMN